jgi:hypothetical protein
MYNMFLKGLSTSAARLLTLVVAHVGCPRELNGQVLNANASHLEVGRPAAMASMQDVPQHTQQKQQQQLLACF